MIKSLEENLAAKEEKLNKREVNIIKDKARLEDREDFVKWVKTRDSKWWEIGVIN